MKAPRSTKGSDMYQYRQAPQLGEAELVGTTQALIELGNLAMQFGRIDRTCVAHVDGVPESDSDHTVMLSWLAPPLAEIINLRAGYERYPVGKVTQYAVVHDASEVYAGDTPTHKITPEAYEAKELAEAHAANRLYNEFIKSLPWFARTVRNYERQADPCSRFVRSVDKIMPKIVHAINAGHDLLRAGMTEGDFRELYQRQRKQIEDWCPEPILLQLYDELCGEVLRHYSLRHLFVVDGEHPPYLQHPETCEPGGDEECAVSHAYNNFMSFVSAPLAVGTYPVAAGPDGLLTFVGK